MAATKQDIRGWFREGVLTGATHLIVVCDTLDWEDYPVFVRPEQAVADRFNEYNGPNMQKVMEVYNLSLPMEEQLDEDRAWRF